MMKKLLILMLVLGLGMASTANAALSDLKLCLNPTTGVLTVVGLTAGVGLDYGIYDITAPIGLYTTPTTIEPDGMGGNAAGALAWIGLFSGVGYDGFEITVADSSPASTDPVDAMDWFTVKYSGSVGEVMEVYDNMQTGSPSIGQLTIVPEPMTIALLGLGSLVLLRRRK